MAACLEEGNIPNVILPDGKDSYELEIPYEEPGSGTEKRAGRIKRGLRAGNTPEEYKGIIESAEVKKIRVYVKDEAAGAATNLYIIHDFMKP